MWVSVTDDFKVMIILAKKKVFIHGKSFFKWKTASWVDRKFFFPVYIILVLNFGIMRHFPWKIVWICIVDLEKNHQLVWVYHSFDTWSFEKNFYGELRLELQLSLSKKGNLHPKTSFNMWINFWLPWKKFISRLKSLNLSSELSYDFNWNQPQNHPIWLWKPWTWYLE